MPANRLGGDEPRFRTFGPSQIGYQLTTANTLFHYKFNASEPTNPTDWVYLQDFGPLGNTLEDQRVSWLGSALATYGEPVPDFFDRGMKLNSRYNFIGSHWAVSDYPKWGLKQGYTITSAESWVMVWVFQYNDGFDTSGIVYGNEWMFPSVRVATYGIGGNMPQVTLRPAMAGPPYRMMGFSALIRDGERGNDKVTFAGGVIPGGSATSGDWFQVALVFDRSTPDGLTPPLYINGVKWQMSNSYPIYNNVSEFGDFVFPTQVNTTPPSYYDTAYHKAADQMAGGGSVTDAPLDQTVWAEWWFAKGTNFKVVGVR